MPTFLPSRGNEFRHQPIRCTWTKILAHCAIIPRLIRLHVLSSCGPTYPSGACPSDLWARSLLGYSHRLDDARVKIQSIRMVLSDSEFWRDCANLFLSSRTWGGAKSFEKRYVYWLWLCSHHKCLSGLSQCFEPCLDWDFFLCAIILCGLCCYHYCSHFLVLRSHTQSIPSDDAVLLSDPVRAHSSCHVLQLCRPQLLRGCMLKR